MNEEVVKKWIQKAENDLKTGKDEFMTNEPATDTICFHMQQCVEKYLKAFLIFHNKEVRKTHDIGELLILCKEIDNTFKELIDLKSHELTDYAVEIRYPDEFYSPSIKEAESTIKIAEKVKVFVIKKLEEKEFRK